MVHRIVVRDLADESDGNAVGMGMVDLVPRRFARKVDEKVTVLNAVTARSPENAKWPIVVDSDRECVRIALETVPQRPEGPRVVYLRDTLELGRAYVSAACFGAIRPQDVEIGEVAPLRWVGPEIVSPFEGP